MYQLQFGPDGKPSSVKLISSQKELLDTRNPGDGFYLKDIGGKKIPLNELVIDQKSLLAGTTDKKYQVLFSIHRAEEYLRLTLQELRGISPDSKLSLHFDMNAESGIKVMETDYMTQIDRGAGQIRVSWPYLWNRHPSNPFGSFALYYAAEAGREDDIIIRIWAEQGLPHPKVPGEWTYPRAKEWIAQWQKMYADQSQFILEAENLQDLYAGVSFAQKIQAKQIYLFTNTWRGDFWPSNQGNWQLRKDVFPNGESDLRKYSDFLLEKGIYLKLHYLSGSQGFSDPVYVADKPDRRLASWGSGVLSQPASAEEKTLYFKPNTDVQLPNHAQRGEAI
ncbi:MAG: hypothetical protein NTV01_20670, partial [Bacteroidia bacterium]|nr:hypothetical protein [Bacteroidia bacterium]